MHFPPFSDEPYNFFAKFLYNTSFISELLPDPETPVTHVNTPNGIFTSKFLRLFSFAPLIVIETGFAFLLFLGTGIFFLPLKYWPVIEFGTFFISSAVPWAITFPPCTPAPGPISITISAAYIVSSSCSTTITVFPKSLNLFNVAKSLSLSLWCNPILGSSNIYSTPVNPEPICVAKRILWASPPDNVPADLESVKYSKPTSIKNWSLASISFKICSAIIFFVLLNCKSFRYFFILFIGISVNSWIFFVPTVTAKLSFFNLAPLQLSQWLLLIYIS